METNRKYLIIGAGLAGCTCGYLLKQAGEDVLLIDCQDLSRKSKLCAGLVTPRGQEELRRVFGLDSERVYRQAITELRAVTDEIEVMVGGTVTKSVHRADLDRYALERYRAIGGEVVDQVRLRDIDFWRKVATGHIGKPSDGREFSCGYDTLIAADGALSWTRKKATGKGPDAILTLETEVPANGAPYTMAYSTGFFGYSWYAPAGKTAKIGCGSFSRGEVDLDAQLRSFADYIGVDYSSRRGAYIPTGSDVLLHARQGRSDVYFLGDAASLVCPPSGEGIFFALHSGRMLAQALAHGTSYEALMAPHVATIARQYRMRDVFFNRAFMRAGLFMAGHSPYGEERAVKFALKHFVSFE